MNKYNAKFKYRKIVKFSVKFKPKKWIFGITKELGSLGSKKGIKPIEKLHNV